MDNMIRKIVFVVAIVGTLYHIYLVVHPYTPLSRYHISILNLTQVQRATHVFLISLLGYLLSILRIRKRKLSGSLPLALADGPGSV